jgi:acetyltransferase-like isoleucine patch superfamily enzyme
MTQDKKSHERSHVPILTYIRRFFTHIRRNVLQIHPTLFFLTILHTIAMNCPIHKLRIIFYKMRGTRIERNVFFGNQVFLEEAFPELITIQENSDLGPGVMILTHDTILHHLDPKGPIRSSQVIIGRNCYIGAGAIILPGVTIGDNSIIGAGAVVTKSIPPGSVATGIPARVVCSREEWRRKHLEDA